MIYSYFMNNLTNNIIIEICCGSYEDALAAYRGGVRRIELNNALYMGGLTPSLASLKLTKKNTDMKVICMVRPRGGGFCYSQEDFEVMKLDGEFLMANGADGLAFGCLNSDCTIEESQTAALTEIVKKYNGEAVFHRAFVCTADPYRATEQLIDAGINRILTSGQKQKAEEGVPLIAALQKKYGSRIELLAGSGINAGNALDIIKATGINQIHSSCKEWLRDPTTQTGNVTFSYANAPHENDYETVSEELVRKLSGL